MSKLSCAIIEDDSVSLSVMEGLAQKTGYFDPIVTFTSSSKAAHWLSENSVDLLLLDIEMPELSGLDLLRALHVRPEVIIISSNPKYALDGFELDVTDFLLKPVTDYARFLAAVHRVKAKPKPMKLPSEGLFIKIDSLLTKLNADDISWIEAAGDYVKIQIGDKSQVVYSTLKKFEEKLPPQKFLRVHRSFIINLSKITNIDSTNLEINKKIIPISGSYREELLNRISIL
jgi:DNA-binding LytR/AlgR family response regulator